MAQRDLVITKVVQIKLEMCVKVLRKCTRIVGYGLTVLFT